MKTLRVVVLFGTFFACGSSAMMEETTEQLTAPLRAGPPFDLAAIRDSSTADCRFEAEHEVLKSGVPIVAYKLSYLSWESIDGSLRPIRIRAFAARPKSATSALPGVVQAHGLGGFADEDSATGLAARLSMFTVVYTGPGGGTTPDNTSEGKPSSDGSGYRMFDTLRDVRGSWFWGHTTAALRGLTCLATRREVDATKLGMTGTSAGAVATLLAAGADDRIRVAVPLSGTLDFAEAVRSPDAWQHALLTQARLDTKSAEWRILNDELIDPTMALRGTTAKILMINGSTDEFFPLTAHLSTLRAISSSAAGDRRTSLVANFDHGCYKLTGGESASTIETRAGLRADGGQRLFFRHHLAGDATFSAIPKPPVVTALPVGPLTLISAVIDRPSTYEVDEVRLWWSGDSSYLYGSLKLDAKSTTRFEKLVPATVTATTIHFVDVQYRTRALLAPQRFSISSEPAIPTSLVPHIRAITSCI